ncbi:MAG TPA: hypothetical protein VM146_16100 [Steroidobacteraceae bacterium]|nr:hypothetical protein [Steroidobacteraceae bacterium]
MMVRQGQREQFRHWLPSQGVDPAPLAELNAEGLELLALRAGDPAAPGPLPRLLLDLRGLWAELPTPAVRRLACAPFSLLDTGFGVSPRWLELRASGVNDLPQGTEPAYFDSTAARSITRRMLVYGWHLARSRPRAACLVFGATLPAMESLAACSLSALEAAAERNGDALRPRWPQQHVFWRELLVAATSGAERRLHELLLGGVQRLAAESLTAQAT